MPSAFTFYLLVFFLICWLNSFSDEFSFFAVFDFASVRFSLDVIGKLGPDVMRKLSSGIPNKTKFVVGWFAEREHSETLKVTVPPSRASQLNKALLLDILNKRWQTLDLVSMMDEYKRSSHEMSDHRVTIMDTLSSLPRFKREEDF